jgi:hypothetical protein
MLVEQDLPVKVLDLIPKYKERKIKSYNTSNRLETGPEITKKL